MILNVLLSYKFQILIEKQLQYLKQNIYKKREKEWIRNERITRPNTFIPFVFWRLFRNWALISIS